MQDKNSLACVIRTVSSVITVHGDRATRFLRRRWQNVCQLPERAGSRRNRIARYRSNACALAVLVFSVIASSGCEAVRDAQSLLFSGFQRSEVWGFVAGFGTTFAAVPDTIAMFKRRSSAGVHPRMAAILALFQVTWIYYGLLIGSRPVVAWNLIAVAINSLNVGAFVYFVRRERARAPGRQASESR